MSSTMCILPLLAALFTAETSFIQSNHPWVAVNPIQKAFLQTYWPHYTDDLNYLRPEELQSRVSNNVGEINQFLKENGFDIQLTDLNSPDAMYVASIMKVLVEWKQKGVVTTIEKVGYGCYGCVRNIQFIEFIVRDPKIHGLQIYEYPAIEMSHDQGNKFSCFKVPNHQEVILALETKNGDTVYMSIANKERSGFELLSYIKGLSDHIKNRTITPEYFDKIIFPMIDIDEKPDISWLIGMNKFGKIGNWEIMEALQQTKFQMDETGAAAQSAVAISMLIESCSCPKIPTVYKIDQPFYLWIMRDGMELPIFAAYFDESSWKRPAKLG